MKTSERLTELADEIAKLLDENRVAVPNESAVRTLRFLAGQVRAWDSYAGEKAARIVDLAVIYYSARRHERYPGGPSMLYTEMSFDLLERIRGQAAARRLHGD